MTIADPRLNIISSIGALVLLALSGCGGGGGGSGSPSVGVADGGQPSSGAGSVQELDLTGGGLGSSTLDGTSFDPAAALTSTMLAFRRVDASNSRQGAASTTLGAQSDERLHVANVTTFYLTCFEVTQAQWTALATRAGLSGPAQLTPWLSASPAGAVGSLAPQANRAAGSISYDLVNAMVAGFNTAAAPGQPHLRLPSEAEWEHACRAGTTTRYSWGEAEDPSIVATYALVRETRTNQGADLVGGSGPAVRQANAFGFYDMSGNLWEWTQSGHGPDATLRGGSWGDNLLSARSANRQSMDRGIPYALAGLRLVLVLP